MSIRHGLLALLEDGLVVRAGAGEAGRTLYALTGAGWTTARPACCRLHRPDTPKTQE